MEGKRTSTESTSGNKLEPLLLRDATVVQVSKEAPLPAPVVESSFATLFPKYCRQRQHRETYIRQAWGEITAKLKQYTGVVHGVKTELDLVKGQMMVKTTRKMWDPYSIIKGLWFSKRLRTLNVEYIFSLFEPAIC